MTANQPSSSPSPTTQATAQPNQQTTQNVSQSASVASQQQQQSQSPRPQQQQPSKQLQSSQAAFSTLPSSDTALVDTESKPKILGSTRRGKQYKCGNCHELGHNQYVFEHIFLFLLHALSRHLQLHHAFHPNISVPIPMLFISLRGYLSCSVYTFDRGQSHLSYHNLIACFALRLRFLRVPRQTMVATISREKFLEILVCIHNFFHHNQITNLFVFRISAPRFFDSFFYFFCTLRAGVKKLLF